MIKLRNLENNSPHFIEQQRVTEGYVRLVSLSIQAQLIKE